MAWYALMSSMFWLVVAGTISLAVGTKAALIGMVLAVVAFGVINRIITGYAAASGLTVALFSRSLFGYIGASLATLIFGATAVYYAVFEGSVIAVAFQTYFGGLSLNLWYLVVVAYSVPLVFGGVQAWLDKFNAVLLPFYVLGIIGAVVWAIAEYGYSGAWFSYEPASTAGISGPGWWFAFTVYMGVGIMMMYTWDYARFSRSRGRQVPRRRSPSAGRSTSSRSSVNGTIGIFLAHTIPTEGALSELSAVLAIVSLMGIFGVRAHLGQPDAHQHGELLPRLDEPAELLRPHPEVSLPRTVWVVVVGAIVYAIMLTNVFSFILDALRYQGVFVVAWIAIALTHIASARVKALAGEEVEFRPGRVPLYNPGGLVAWFVLLRRRDRPARGGRRVRGATWSAPITAVLAAGMYAAALAVARRDWFVLHRGHDPRAEVDDPWQARVRCWHCEKAYVAVEMDRDPITAMQPICAACASESVHFHRAARVEAGTLSARMDPI